ncbi:efflux RND transporter periplasmic adaptor subunit [Sphingobacterium sp. SRCM116780]|uniref:efflux RND transporter periplasmic adaptor subunit n=1 Tax=Sphingobacterium sp. SRCM116780 TaxID=2907623 RepID=UPI001F1F50D4|nr:efflux RND transporter periplasmic adaptor subunit [Sphingobacterium sp. SRCM116780]UIR54831.1 efflux RND transporter periplasmic adaptor subunit [Sphingobacterium sp. SRCM116780]
MKAFNKSVILYSTILIVAMGLHSCSNSKAEKETKEEISTVNAFLLQQEPLSDTLTIAGELLAFQQVDLYAKMNSFVRQLTVDVGSKVNKGQLLAVMDAPEMNAQQDVVSSRMQSQEAIYMASKATYDRLLETSKTPGTISQNDLEQAEARKNADYGQLQASKAMLRESKNNRSYLEIRAPFSGVITSRNVSQGAFVGVGAGAVPLFTLQEQDKLRLIIQVPESNAGAIQLGQRVDFTVRSIPEQIFTSKAARLSGALDNRLRAQRIEMDVINKDNNLLPGMIPEVQLVLQASTKNTFVVPQSALLRSSQGTFIIKVEKGKTIWVPVQTGISSGDRISIFSSLSLQDTLISNATEEIRNGAVMKGQLKIVQ